MKFSWYDDGNANPWQSWYDRQNNGVRAKHDVVMRFLKAGHWREPYAKQLKNHDGLIEIIITKGVAHRLLGFHGTEDDEFTVVLSCTHKGKQYDPKHALATATDRMKAAKEGGIKIVKHCDAPKAKTARTSKSEL